MSIGSADTTVTVNIRKGDETGKEAIKETKDELYNLVHEVRRAVRPMRIVSMDIWSLAYASRRLGVVLGIQTNPAFQAFYGILVSAAAALRIVVVLQELSSILTGVGVATKLAAVAQSIYNGVLAQTAFWVGIISGGLVTIAGLAAWAAISTQKPTYQSMQTGGVAQYTGPHFLHKGERVLPAGTNYSWINIQMQTGPISSHMDVNNMLDEMALRMAVESRRRNG